MNYYKPCKELDECNRLIKEYFEKGLYKECFEGHLRLAEQGYALAECQSDTSITKAWALRKTQGRRFTGRSARHFTVTGCPMQPCSAFLSKWRCREKDFEKAKEWLLKAAAETTMQ